MTTITVLDLISAKIAPGTALVVTGGHGKGPLKIGREVRFEYVTGVDTRSAVVSWEGGKALLGGAGNQLFQVK